MIDLQRQSFADWLDAIDTGMASFYVGLLEWRAHPLALYLRDVVPGFRSIDYYKLWSEAGGIELPRWAQRYIVATFETGSIRPADVLWKE